MSVRYDVTELCCALKPSLIAHLLNAGESGRATSTATCACSRRSKVSSEALDAPPVPAHPAPALAARLTTASSRASSRSCWRARSTLGSPRRASTGGSERCSTWWSERLRTGSRLDPAHGMVFDQRWADLMPGLFGAVGHLARPGRELRLLASRDAGGSNATARAPGRRRHPLRCFHFTRLRPEPSRAPQPAIDNRVALDREPVLRALCAEFTERLARTRSRRGAARWPYGFAATASGVALDADAARAVGSRVSRRAP